MQIHDGQDALLDRGGHPTLRELLRQLVFSPGSGTIRLNKERLILQRANHMSRLRDQLVQRYCRDEAFVILTQLGFVAGLEDADFVRLSWPGLDPGDVFTAGTRLHMLCGCVRLRTVHNDFDLRRGRFSGEFLWQGSVEAVEHRRNHGLSDEAVCWSQVGYASGYATRCFGKLIIYKELECLGAGRDHCRVVGKPAETWGEDEDLVKLYRREILPGEMDGVRADPFVGNGHGADSFADAVHSPPQRRTILGPTGRQSLVRGQIAPIRASPLWPVSGRAFLVAVGRVNSHQSPSSAAEENTVGTHQARHQAVSAGAAENPPGAVQSESDDISARGGDIHLALDKERGTPDVLLEVVNPVDLAGTGIQAVGIAAQLDGNQQTIVNGHAAQGSAKDVLAVADWFVEFAAVVPDQPGVLVGRSSGIKVVAHRREIESLVRRGASGVDAPQVAHSRTVVTFLTDTDVDPVVV